MNLSPAAKVPLYLADFAPALKRHEAAIAALGRFSEVKFMDALPREATGKIFKRKLRDLHREGQLHAAN